METQAMLVEELDERMAVATVPMTPFMDEPALSFLGEAIVCARPFDEDPEDETLDDDTLNDEDDEDDLLDDDELEDEDDDDDEDEDDDEDDDDFDDDDEDDDEGFDEDLDEDEELDDLEASDDDL